ncbi:protein containing PAS domain [Sulfurimonas gotlandica GD1]|uniref:Protein containing PAS domain n=1 Tax=Sulfurimonas gotlandica (strain DSM 19862 / JCM 16533 / GD1) TaxID=929558 RepID=B6BMH5_SULGG|nr:PAS domain S-box protein [Sulfurimonas gotlandica]EDZ61876.1 diguanylate cyclase domain protein [Sulfurimonas gotlandica GD1]EHP29246.1 protein containing PAS domain [Sulfurimonas gotlandica GD1]
MKDCQSNILEQYRYIVDETSIVSKSDLLGTITYVNNKFLETTGYSAGELLGQPHSILRNPDTPSSVFKELWDIIQAKKIWRGILENIKKDGSKYTVEASIYPILNCDGNVMEYISIRHDITELKELNLKNEMLREYDISQQNAAREKLEAGIVNELDAKSCKVIYHPSDILCGDFYSLFKREDGSIFIYLLDGQGHGVSPALTVFAASATIKELVKGKGGLKKICKKLFPTIRTFLGELEQLSYIMIMINPKGDKLSYASGGMYPFKLKNKKDIIRIKANNLPFMDFSDIPEVSKIDIPGWKSVMLYSDGLVEHAKKDEDHFLPRRLINDPSLIDYTANSLNKYEFSDDVTLIHLENNFNS